jgi:glycosyltransferase involved in cell wall biosynthesis
VRLTVAVCTWNRADLLAATLDRLAHAAPPSAPWELIVVDNGSTDHTSQVLERFSARLPLRRIVETKLGLSNARNAAVANASGDYILWTDDDVLVDPGWLRSYEDACRRWPDAAVFGGPIRAQFEGTPPAWLVAVWPRVAGAFAERDLGDRPAPLDASEPPYGANFAVRTREQRRFPYDPELGRRGRAGNLFEETTVIEAILSTGATGWWVPEAAVSHWVSKDRQTVGYLREYFERVGRARPPLEDPRKLRTYLRAEYAYRKARLTAEPSEWIDAMIKASMLKSRVRWSRSTVT